MPTPPIPRYEEDSEEIPPSVLADFIAKAQSKEVQDGMEAVKEQKKRRWEGKEIKLKESEQKKVYGKFQDTYLDPRVKLVVVSYPTSSIEKNHPTIFYPDVKVKKRELQSGWCNIVVSINTDERGNAIRQNILRPAREELSEREKLFLEHTLEELKGWSFDRVKSEIVIDVRYFVE